MSAHGQFQMSIDTGTSPHGDLNGGEFCPERLAPLPGRLVCDRYAAASRHTCFSCSNSRFRRRSSHNSADWCRV